MFDGEIGVPSVSKGRYGLRALAMTSVMERHLLLVDFSVSSAISPMSDLPNDGRALSFALKLRNRNNGTNQTQTAKKAATSPKAGPSLWLPAPYRYFGVRNRFASLALAEKWKNQVKWSAMTRAHDARNRGEVREMNGHEEEKLER